MLEALGDSLGHKASGSLNPKPYRFRDRDLGARGLKRNKASIEV